MTTPDEIKARLAAIVDSSDDAIISKTLDGIITSWNRGAENIFGYAAAEAIGKHISLIIPADRLREEDDVISRIRRGERIDHFETLRQTKAGHLIEVSLTVSPVKDSLDRVIGASKVARDITGRRRAEEAVAKLAAIVESSDDAIISKTLDGIITSWNRSAEKIFGYAAAEAVGQHISLIIPADRHSEEADVISRIRRGEKIDHFETVRQAKDGRLLEVSLTVSPMRDPQQRVIGASKVARDITGRKRAHEEREALLLSERHARSEAERAARLKEEFLATLSHELRTPLNAIVGWVHILKTSPLTQETLDKGLSVIDRNVRLQVQLIADLLDMSRIASGKMRMDVQKIEFPPIIAAAIESIQPAAMAKGIRIYNIVEPNADPLHGDSARLQQVVWNLLSNAVKFTPRGGRIVVILSRVSSHVELAVSDNGEGIKPDFLPYVFDRFRQGDSSKAREHGGLGLGLSIVRQLVELHGGSVRAASGGEGQGSTFTIALPLAAVHSTPADPVTSHPTADPMSLPEYVTISLVGVRVLVVDDETDAREVIRRVLEGSHAHVILAASADDALSVLRKETVDVILSDIGMPGRDGYALMQEARRCGFTAPAAALTAFARSEDRTRALQAGYQTHLAKPVEPPELVAAVAALARATPPGSARGA